MPLELIDDISRGRSWLSFARRSKPVEQAAGSLQYEYDQPSDEPGEISESGSSGRLSARRPGTKFPGKTYDSVESIEEFFRKRAAKMGGYGSTSGRDRNSSPVAGRPDSPPPAGPSGTAPQSSRSALSADGDVRAPSTDILPGSYVRHAKYGRGLVLRREGSGDQTKFTVSFPAMVRKN